jgi:hypothetical protein
MPSASRGSNRNRIRKCDIIVALTISVEIQDKAGYEYIYNQSKRTSKVLKVLYYSENDNFLGSVNYWAIVCSFLHKVISLIKIPMYPST